MLARALGITAQMQQPAPLRLPARQQVALLRRRRLRREPRQLMDALRGLLEAPGEQQRRRQQPDQLRRTEHQLIALLFMQAQQQHRVLLAEQVFETEVLQQAHRHFIFFGEQGVFKRGLPVLFGGEPLAGAAMP